MCEKLVFYFCIERFDLTASRKLTCEVSLYVLHQNHFRRVRYDFGLMAVARLDE